MTQLQSTLAVLAIIATANSQALAGNLVSDGLDDLLKALKEIRAEAAKPKPNPDKFFSIADAAIRNKDCT